MIEDMNVYEITLKLKTSIVSPDAIDLLHKLAEELKDCPFEIVGINIDK